ncbi:MAG: 16S rRNA (guanine(527)-N(7))-methyltransferase RsmG [Actinobacteria bacterium]|nr:16S rRNA (guanine(527)-N(7))-methyltransferase RsmG [Actinomycetota bacterium]
MYALRDVTATVNSMPLIASSIMSKKLASGADIIVLDVKVGDGAFMKTTEDAKTLARLMVEIGKLANKKMIAVLTNMDEPLGHYVGNAHEIHEAVQTLLGKGPEDINHIASTLVAHLLMQSNIYQDFDQFFERHVLHSLGIAKIMNFEEGTKVLDVGTGGGFPGIPLAILFPKVDFFLVDSIGKKIKVVREVAQELGLKNVRTAHERAENINEKFDFVVSRAVTRMR